MKIKKRLYPTNGISNVDNISNDKNKTPFGSRLDPVQTEVDQAKESRMATETDINLKNDNSQPDVKQAMDHSLMHSLYLLPPFI